MRRRALGVLALSAWLLPAVAVAVAVEPRIFVIGVWPNRIRFFDEATETFVDEMQLRNGAVTNVFGSDHTRDGSRFFFVTDRMETVEVADLRSRKIVDEIKLSSPDRRVRFWSAAPTSSGKELYLVVNVVDLEVDRYLPEAVDVIRYDLEAHRVIDSFAFPTGIDAEFLPPFVSLSPDDALLYAIADDVYVLDAKTYQLVDRIELGRRRAPGFPAPGLGFGAREAEPGVLYGINRSPDPVLGKPMLGITRVELATRRVETFDVGIDAAVEWLGISPDGKRGYAGMGDLVAVDMESHRTIARKDAVERGRQNTTINVSADGARLYVAGVGPRIQVYDAVTLEPLRTIDAGADIMNPPQAIPRSAIGR
jgi:hypothetical protein